MSMLDDFVEHSAGPSAPPKYASTGPSRNVPSSRAIDLSDIEHEGFEVDADDARSPGSGMVQALETGFIPSARLANSSLPPLFSLSLVQYNPPSDLICLTAANNILFLAAYPLSIIIIDLNKPDELVTVDLPRPAQEKGSSTPQNIVIKSLFVDPTARHLLVTTSSNDAFYLPISPGNSAVQSRRPRPLRVRQNISTVAWSPIIGSTTESGPTTESTPSKNDAVTPPSTDVLLGTSDGKILSLPLPPQDDIFKSVSISMSKPVERDLQIVYSLPEDQAVTGIAFGFWADSGPKPRRAWVITTTNERIYEVQGEISSTSLRGRNGGWAEEVFRTYRDGAPNFQELPGNTSASQLRTFASPTDAYTAALAPPTAMAWTTGPGLYTSPLSTTPATDAMTKPSLIPYPSLDKTAFKRSQDPTSTAPAPIAISITRWHWLLVYADRIVGVSRETEQIVYNEALPLGKDEVPLGLSADPISQTYWIYTNKSILEILVQHEDRDVWRAKLDKNEFADAHRYARSEAQRNIILSRQGDSLFEEGRFIQSAQCYAKSSRSFEFVALRFVDADERDALRIYLSEKLDLMNKKDVTQRMMLATWLVEIYLSKCNQLEDIIAAESATTDVESLSVEKQLTEEDMQNFIQTYQNDLEPKVVYELIQNHGRTDLYLFYANLRKDHHKVIEHWIREEAWSKAIDVLNRQSSVDPYYRFASVLMMNVPTQTVDAWCRRSDLIPRRLIPALLQYRRPPNEKITSDQAVRYLSHVTQQLGSTDTIVWNLLITLFASDPNPDDGPLLDLLNSCPDDPITEKPYYDLDYALRICKQHSRIQPCIFIYSKMGLYENSVDMALQKGDLELAKINADRPEGNDMLRRKLWLKVAKYVVQDQKDIKSAMKFLESTDLVKIEDILPFFPDFAVIDDFKTEICGALEDYAAKIEELKAEMNEATAAADSIKRDIEGLSNRFVMIEQGDKCWKCGLTLVTRQFYVFPCQHSFHADCLISMAMEYLPAPSLRRILHLQNELVSRSKEPTSRALLSSTFSPSGSGANTPRKQKGAITSGSAATDLLLGVTGRNKLLAAGDRLREMIIPDALAQAITGGAGLNGTKTKTSRDREREDHRAEEARIELDELVAGVCPLCEGAVAGLDKPFIKDGELTSAWEI